MARPFNLDLRGMSREGLANALENLVFTAARNWIRSVKIDRETRDLLVSALKEPTPTEDY